WQVRWLGGLALCTRHALLLAAGAPAFGRRCRGLLLGSVCGLAFRFRFRFGGCGGCGLFFRSFGVGSVLHRLIFSQVALLVLLAGATGANVVAFGSLQSGDAVVAHVGRTIGRRWRK